MPPYHDTFNKRCVLYLSTNHYDDLILECPASYLILRSHHSKSLKLMVSTLQTLPLQQIWMASPPVNLPGNTAENRQEQHLCGEKGKTCITGGCFWLMELHLVTSKKKKGRFYRLGLVVFILP